MLAVWTGAVDMDWNTAGNWDTKDVPNTAGESAVFNGAGEGTISLRTGIMLGTVTVNSGSYTFAPSTGSGGITATSLTKVGSGTLTVQGAALGNIYTLGAVTVTAGTLAFDNLKTLSFGSLTNDGTVRFNTVNNDIIVSAPVSGAGQVFKSGAAKLSYNASASPGGSPNTYTGRTTVEAGTLSLNKTPSDAGGALKGDVLVKSGATLEQFGSGQVAATSALGGTGTITGPVAGLTNLITSAIINPGDSTGAAGTLTFAKVPTLASGARITIDLAMAGAAPVVDQVRVNAGNLALGGATVDLVVAPEFKASKGQVFTIIDNAGLGKTSGSPAGTLNGVAISFGDGAIITTDAGQRLRIQYVGNDVQLVYLNSAPSATNDSYTTAEDTSLVIAAPGVLSNDGDRDGDAMKVATVNGVTVPGDNTPVTVATAHGSVSIKADGSFVFTPTLNYNGSEALEFTYVNSDGAMTSNAARVLITVTPVNDAPTTPADMNAASNVIAEAVFSGTQVGITASSVDVESSTLTYSLLDNAGGRFAIDPVTGVVVVANAALINYEDAATHTITVQVSDGDGGFAQADFSIAVANVAPTAPVDQDSIANSVLEGAASGTSAGIAVLSADPNGIRGGAGVIYSLTNDAGGRFTIDSSTGVVTVADSRFLDGPASHVVTVQASDGAGGVSAANFTISVVNAVPTATADSFAVGLDSSFSGNVLVNDTDPAGALDPLKVTSVTVNGTTYAVPATGTRTLVTGRGTLVIAATGAFTYTPGIGTTASGDAFSYTIDDGDGGVATGSVAATINGIASLPAGVSRLGGVLYLVGREVQDVITTFGGKLVINGGAVSLAGVGEIRMWTLGGNDLVDLSGVAIRSFVDGGDGMDQITGSQADDVLLGGAGADAVRGGLGNDIVVGGLGTDNLFGNVGNDILVAGDFGTNISLAGLRQTVADWMVDKTVDDASENDLIRESSDTTIDVLTGGSGADWFVISSTDWVGDSSVSDGDVVWRLIA